MPHASSTNPVLFFSLSPKLFAIHGDRRKRLYAAHHPSAVGVQHYLTMLSYPREETLRKKGEGIHHSESAADSSFRTLIM